ncbi:hypothetical protein BBOV_VI_pgp10 (apicoplast) [Babesia bovis T2Bo]|uniref:Rps13 n=1 Tax=Babesia bovis TaxID=5865 RepID=A7AXG3_BABBO|nr:hypothetical protein BBOV_VI_pgp10 [Babesia bovis T2Bo]EDO05086.1 hypothetical protein BBOV_V000360 [Babesia bovis T2Bo]|eukprot:YP_002290866.1 rps13 (apicoplast) [Babesia bovis T2Bo]
MKNMKNFTNNNMLHEYIKFNCICKYKLYKKFFNNHCIRNFKISKKKYKCKYSFNLLNSCYSYSYAYLARYVYRNLYKIKYVNENYIKVNNNINSVILYFNKIFIKKKQKKSMKYDIIMGSGSSKSWVGVGYDKNSIYKNACSSASLQSKKYIYNLKLNPNDYKVFKYKNYKFSILDKSPNKRNFDVYNSLTTLSGIKKLKLVSYTKTSTKTLLKSILYYFN